MTLDAQLFTTRIEAVARVDFLKFSKGYLQRDVFFWTEGWPDTHKSPFSGLTKSCLQTTSFPHPYLFRNKFYHRSKNLPMPMGAVKSPTGPCLFSTQLRTRTIGCHPFPPLRYYMNKRARGVWCENMPGLVPSNREDRSFEY